MSVIRLYIGRLTLFSIPCVTSSYSISQSYKHFCMSENEEKTTATAVKGSDKHVVPYKDFALEADTSSNEKVLRYADTSRVRNPFPVQLHCILSQLELDGLTDIAEWKPHGRCFTVHKQREFEDKVLNRFVIRMYCRILVSSHLCVLKSHESASRSKLAPTPQMVSSNHNHFLSATIEHLRIHSIDR